MKIHKTLFEDEAYIFAWCQLFPVFKDETNTFIAFEIRNIGLSGLWVLDNKIEPFSNCSMTQYKAMKQ